MTSSLPLSSAPSVVGSYVALRFYATFRYVLHTLYYYAEACGSSSSMWRCLPLLLFLLRGETLLSLLLLFLLCFRYCCCCICCFVCRHHQCAAGTPPPALPASSVSACFCRFLVFNIHLKLSCPLLAPGCPSSPFTLPPLSPLRLC